MTKEIPLSQGKVTIVDDEDYPALALFDWYCSLGYAVRNRNGAGRGTIRMHRFILGAPSNMDVDHINGDRLDNRRCNLRLCTTSENCRNQRKPNTRQFTSKYKGVSRAGGVDGKWQAGITVNRRLLNLGVFTSEDQAALAYNEAARKYHGDFARLNEVHNEQ